LSFHPPSPRESRVVGNSKLMCEPDAVLIQTTLTVWNIDIRSRYD
jgi:hypothetical protein